MGSEYNRRRQEARHKDLFVGVVGQPNKPWTQGQKHRLVDAVYHDSEPEQDIDISQDPTQISNAIAQATNRTQQPKLSSVQAAKQNAYSYSDDDSLDEFAPVRGRKSYGSAPQAPEIPQRQQAPTASQATTVDEVSQASQSRYRSKNAASRAPEPPLVVDPVNASGYEYKIFISSIFENNKPENMIESIIIKGNIGTYPDLQHLQTQREAKATSWCHKKNQPSYLSSVRSTPYFTKLAIKNKRPIDIDDNKQWETVDEQLRGFFDAGNTDGLAVDIVYRFERSNPQSTIIGGKGSKTKASTTTKIRPDSDVIVADTPTNALLAERSQAYQGDDLGTRISKQHDDLLTMWHCEQKMCFNYEGSGSGYCYIDNGEHLKMEPGQVKIWAHNILKDQTNRITESKPPVSLLSDFRQASRKHKKQAEKEKDKGTPFSGPPPQYIYPPGAGGYVQPPILTLQSPYLGQPMKDIRDMRTSELERELEIRNDANYGRQYREISTREPSRLSSVSAKYSVPPRRSKTATPYRELPLRSSPVPPTANGDLEQFIQFMKEISPSNPVDFEEAYKTLNDQGFQDLSTFQYWKDDTTQWTGIGIKPGIGIQMAKNLSRFYRERGTALSYGREQPTTRRNTTTLRISPPAGSKRTKELRILPSIEDEGGVGYDDDVRRNRQLDRDLDEDDEWDIDDSQLTQG